MKRIEAFVQPHKLREVISALHGLPNFPGFTVLDAYGQGHGRGDRGGYTYDNREGLLGHRCCLLVVISQDESVSRIVDTIIGAAHTGQQGDGIIDVVNVDALFRIGKAEAHA